MYHASPGEVVDLRALGPRLKTAKTAAIVKSDEFEAIRLIVQAGRVIAPHRVEGEMTLHCLEGCVRLKFGSSSLELAAGQWLYLNRGLEHSVEGVEDSSLLLTILLPNEAR